ncbi:MAG TPA: hypothetical protein VHL58_01685, partial [Thermoanaerobaculia bacterium]|nr:hypothetical protein [Thermoanaerobaculia bacterium]
MRAVPVFLILIVMATSLSGQRVPPGRSSRNQSNTMNAEMSIKQAAQQLGAEKKAFERDIEVLRHLRAADEAMTDPMQPTTSVQKAYEEVGAAKALVTDFLVKQGVVRMDEELERA